MHYLVCQKMLRLINHPNFIIIIDHIYLTHPFTWSSAQILTKPIEIKYFLNWALLGIAAVVPQLGNIKQKIYKLFCCLSILNHSIISMLRGWGLSVWMNIIRMNVQGCCNHMEAPFAKECLRCKNCLPHQYISISSKYFML